MEINGAKINLYSLLNTKEPNIGTINISKYNGGVAQWVNVYNQWNAIYTKNDSSATETQKDAVSKRIYGTVSIRGLFFLLFLTGSLMLYKKRDVS